MQKLDMLPAYLKVISEERLKFCDECPMRVGNTCSRSKTGVHVKTGKAVRGCGCNLAAKTLEEGQKCPLGKW
jgi:hypothetical protein